MIDGCKAVREQNTVPSLCEMFTRSACSRLRESHEIIYLYINSGTLANDFSSLRK